MLQATGIKTLLGDSEHGYTEALLYVALIHLLMGLLIRDHRQFMSVLYI